MIGNRKFWAFVLSLISFTTITLTHPNTDPFNLGMAITMIAGAFFVTNAVVHATGKTENKSA
jgi:hypothetical protein